MLELLELPCCSCHAAILALALPCGPWSCPAGLGAALLALELPCWSWSWPAGVAGHAAAVLALLALELPC